MFYLLKVFIKDPWVYLPLTVSIVAEFFMWIYIFAKLGFKSDILFLHYNVIFGIDLVGEWWRILFLPLVGLLILVINYLAAIYCYNKDKIVSRFLTVFVSVFEIFLAVAVYFTVDINL